MRSRDRVYRWECSSTKHPTLGTFLLAAVYRVFDGFKKGKLAPLLRDMNYLRHD